MVDAILRAATEYSIIGAELSGTITVFNRGAERMLGYQADEVVGRMSVVALHDPDEVVRRADELGIAPGFEVLTSVARGGSSETRDWTYVRQDGSRLSVSLSVTAILNEDGTPTGFLGIARDLSDEQDVRAAARRSADSFATVFEANPIPTLVSRVADGLILMANAACLSVFGWPAEEIVGKTVAEVSLWAEPEQRPVMVDRLRADGRVRDLEVAVRCRNGEIKRTLGSLELLGLDGQPCLIAVFQDLTEQTRLEAALRESEQRLTAFLDHAPAIVSIKDRDGRYLLINRRITEYLGLRPSEFIGGSTRELFPAAADEAEKAEERVLAEGAVVTLEQSLAGADGVMHDYQVLKFPLRSADGAVYAVGTIATEVTERQLGAQRAAELFDSFTAPVTIYEPILGAAGQITDFLRVYANPRNAELVGRPLEEVIGASLRETSIPALFNIVFPVYVRVFQTGTSEVLPTVEMTDPATGNQLILAVQVLRVGDRVAQVSRDVTLERIAEGEIRAARAEAEAANRAKSEFLSRMSHELRTPLNAILGFSELLKLDELTPEQLDSVDHIRKGGKHLLLLIDEVLDLSRIESGHLPVSLEPVRLDEVAREAMDMVAPIAAARRISLADALPRTGGYVLADRQRLKQVILNLLSNAVKYNREGGDVRLFCDTIGSERLALAVADTGIGIAEANLDRVFTPFERLGAEQSEVEGTGLGLALTKRLVEAMRGTIRAESEVGRGTTFWIELEVTEAPAEQPAVPHAPAAVATHQAGTFDATVLYIEDNVSNVQLVERIVARRPGVVLLSAMQGSIGLEMALRHRPDLILLDLNLPDMSGDEVLRRLRAEPETAQTPVVVISADATGRQVDSLRSIGATDYLTKPFEVAVLLGWIDRVAGGGELPEPTTSRRKVVRPARATQLPAAEEDLLDPNQVRSLRELDGDGEALRAIAQIFLHEATGQVDRISVAARSGDVDAVGGAAHSLKGSARTIGAVRLATLAAAIERAARKGRGPVEPALIELREMLVQTNEAVAHLTDAAS